MPTTEAIVADSLVKTYPARRGAPPLRALDGLNLQVPSGSVLALLGPNGAGKTTTVKILTTLAVADAGNARVAGADVRTEPDAVRLALGLVAQRPTAAPMATGRENLVLAGRLHGLTRAEAQHRAEELLHRFGLAEAGDRLAKHYSGGMARKLDVAVGLVHRPGVLFLDEPTTGLDPQARADMWAEIERLAGDERITILLTTHYLEEADRLADLVAIVDHGQVVVTGTPEELKSRLRGDTLLIELESAAIAGQAVSALSGRTGVRDLVADGARVRARTDDGARAVPGVLAALDGAGISAVAVSVARPSLDDVYLAQVGRALEEAA